MKIALLNEDFRKYHARCGSVQYGTGIIIDNAGCTGEIRNHEGHRGRNFFPSLAP